MPNNVFYVNVGKLLHILFDTVATFSTNLHTDHFTSHNSALWHVCMACTFNSLYIFAPIEQFHFIFTCISCLFFFFMLLTSLYIFFLYYVNESKYRVWIDWLQIFVTKKCTCSHCMLNGFDKRTLLSCVVFIVFIV